MLIFPLDLGSKDAVLCMTLHTNKGMIIIFNKRKNSSPGIPSHSSASADGSARRNKKPNVNPTMTAERVRMNKRWRRKDLRNFRTRQHPRFSIALSISIVFSSMLPSVVCCSPAQGRVQNNNNKRGIEKDDEICCSFTVSVLYTRGSIRCSHDTGVVFPV